VKQFAIAIAALVILLVISLSALGQKTTRIKFARGATSAIVSGTINGYRSHRAFVIRVRRGQTLTTENVDKNYITIGIDAPPGSTYEQDMAADCHHRNNVSPTAAGDYRIDVTECRKADAWKGRFRFRVTVR
jgi:hypothetical protein